MKNQWLIVLLICGCSASEPAHVSVEHDPVITATPSPTPIQPTPVIDDATVIRLAISSASKAVHDAEPKTTAKVYEVAESPADYSGQCIRFYSCWLRGDVKADGGVYLLGVKDDREDEHDEVLFSCEKGLANVIREKLTATQMGKATLYCRIEKTSKSASEKEVVAWVYKIIFLNDSGAEQEYWTPEGAKPKPKVRYALNSKGELAPVQD